MIIVSRMHLNQKKESHGHFYKILTAMQLHSHCSVYTGELLVILEAMRSYTQPDKNIIPYTPEYKTHLFL